MTKKQKERKIIILMIIIIRQIIYCRVFVIVSMSEFSFFLQSFGPGEKVPWSTPRKKKPLHMLQGLPGKMLTSN